MMSGALAVAATVVLECDGVQSLKVFWAWSAVNVIHVGLLIAMQLPGSRR